MWIKETQLLGQWHSTKDLPEGCIENKERGINK